MKHIQKYYFGEKNTFSFLFETEKNIFFRRINYIMCKVEQKKFQAEKFVMTLSEKILFYGENVFFL